MANRIIFPKKFKKSTDLKKDLQKMGMTKGNAKQKLLQACAIALKMAEYSYGEIAKVKARKGKKRIKAFNDNALLKKWFGEIKSKGQVRNMISRFNTIKKRLSKGVKIRLRPNSEDTHNGKNMGSFTSPRRFKIYARLLTSNKEKIASVLVHELLHEWFTDKKLANGKDVEDASDALNLVSESAGKSRRSPENFEQYYSELYK
jgi:hypothetical protein